MPADSREVVERIAFQRARQQVAATEIESIERQLAISRKRITPAVIAEFGQMLRAKLVAGCPPITSASPAPASLSNTC